MKDLRGIVKAQRHQNNTDAGDRLKDLCRDLDDLYDVESEFTATAWACAKELDAVMIVRLAKEVARSLDRRLVATSTTARRRRPNNLSAMHPHRFDVVQRSRTVGVV